MTTPLLLDAMNPTKLSEREIETRGSRHRAVLMWADRNLFGDNHSAFFTASGTGDFIRAYEILVTHGMPSYWRRLQFSMWLSDMTD